VGFVYPCAGKGGKRKKERKKKRKRERERERERERYMVRKDGRIVGREKQGEGTFVEPAE